MDLRFSTPSSFSSSNDHHHHGGNSSSNNSNSTTNPSLPSDEETAVNRDHHHGTYIEHNGSRYGDTNNNNKDKDDTTDNHNKDKEDNSTGKYKTNSTLPISPLGTIKKRIVCSKRSLTLLSIFIFLGFWYMENMLKIVWTTMLIHGIAGSGAAPPEDWIPEVQQTSYTDTPTNCLAWEDIRQKYHNAAGTPSDISQHVPILRALGASVPTVLELGVRTVVSSWAFGMAGVDRARHGLKFKYTAGDITREPMVDELESILLNCAAIDFTFIEGDDLKIPPITADLIFIDTWHVYRQLHLELIRYSKLARKYIVLHDTTLFGERDESIHGHGGKPEDETLYPKETRSITGLWAATEELLRKGEWRV